MSSLRKTCQGARRAGSAAWIALLLSPAVAAAQGSLFGEGSEDGMGLGFHMLDLTAQLVPVRHAIVSLPLACALGATLSFRPRRRGTPPRDSAVIQTQVILAIVGAIVMLVVGSSIARAFGIVGVASLIRYRAKVDNPKDAGVMLAALGVGLASGVGLYLLAVFATIFLLATLWVLESFEPSARRVFHLKVSFDGTPPKLRVEELLRRLHVEYELRSAADGELCYEVRVPLSAETDRLSSALVATTKATAVEWERKSSKRNGA
jgi:hypothetical protein